MNAQLRTTLAAVPAVLCLDTATPAVTAAVVAIDTGAAPRPLAVRVTDNARAHGELLAPSVTAVLAEAGLAAGDLAAIAVGLGPGPYTGLRVGLVTAAALADSLDIPAYGVCTLDAVAWPVAGTDGHLLAATDARRKEVYWATYDATGERLVGPEVSRPADLAARLGELGVTAATGAGAARYADALGLAPIGVGRPDPTGLAALAADRVLSGAPSEPLTPLYLRRPDAVEPGRPKPVSTP